VTYGQAIEHFGTQAKLAEALGISQASVSAGIKRWHGVPPAWQYELEIKTGGVLRASPELRKSEPSDQHLAGG
jgi:DNA-binding transcriptional regulator YdaS (Cro superfamily)